MPAFKDPGFQQRQEAAARAKSASLAKYRSRPPIDEAVMAERTARRIAREAAEAEKRAAARRAKEEAAEAKQEQERLAAAAADAAAKPRPPPTRRRKPSPKRLLRESSGPKPIARRRATRAMPRGRCARADAERSDEHRSTRRPPRSTG
jgi:hypothetical protein